MLKKNEFIFSESIFAKVLLIVGMMPSAIFVSPFCIILIRLKFSTEFTIVVDLQIHLLSLFYYLFDYLLSLFMNITYYLRYEMMNYKWYLMVPGQYMTILAGTWSA